MDIGDFEAGKINIPDWISRHGTDAVDPIVQSTLDHMREKLGITKITAAGNVTASVARYVLIINQQKIDYHPTILTISSMSLASSREAKSISVSVLIHHSYPTKSSLPLRTRSPFLLQVGGSYLTFQPL